MPLHADDYFECSVDLDHMVDELLDDPDDYDACVRMLERLCLPSLANRWSGQTTAVKLDLD